MLTRIRGWLAFVAVAGLAAGRLSAAPSSVTLATSGNPSAFGRLVTLTATIAPASATGKVTFYDDTTVLGIATVANGQAAFTTILLPSGSQPLHAYYSGDAHYASSLSETLVQTVRSVPANGFAPAGTYPMGGFPTSVAVADFNRDGKADLAATGIIGGGVSVLAGNGDGTFKAAVWYPAGTEPASLAIGDFNGDGIPDLAVANSASGNVSVLLGKGDGTFGAAVNYVTGPQSSFVAVGDFNGDGKTDLVVANSGTGLAGSISVLLGNGDGTFEAAVNSSGACHEVAGYLPTCQMPSVIAVADFNGDGKADLAVSYGDTVSVLLGNGDGTFQPAVDIESGVSSAYVVVGDFNGDGKADIAVLISNSVLDVLLGNGDGTFQPAVSYSSGADTYTSHTSILVADFNGDGKPDLMVGTTGDNGSFVKVLLGNGDGTFQSNLQYAVGFFTPAVAGDFTGDGRVDLGGYGTGGVSVLLASIGLPTTTTLTSSPNPSIYGQSLTLTANVSPPAATGSVAFFNGASTAPVSNGQAVLAVDSLLVGTYSLTAVYTGDLTYDNSTSPPLTQTVDPVPETVALTSSANPSTYGQNVTLTATLSPQSPPGYFSVSGTVTFMDGTTWLGIRSVNGSQASFSVATLAVGSHPLTATYSGDAYHTAGTSSVLTQTVVQGTVTTPTIALTSSANPSTFGQSVTLTATVSLAGSGRVTFYDGAAVLGTRSLVNGQAALTTSLLASGKRSLRAYYGGSASYTPSSSATITQTVNTVQANGFQLVTNSGPAAAPVSIAVGDFNEDGKADVAVTGNAGNVIVMLGKGDGTFQPAVSLPLGGNPSSVVVGDFNGDGHTDLAVGNGNNVTVLLGNGNGTFQSAVEYAAGYYPQALAVADLNGDGVADLVALIQSGVAVLLGNGDGTFQTAMNVASVNGGALAIGDFNGDGVPDLAVVRAAGSCIFISACVGQLTGRGVSVLLGYGDGTFQPPVNYPSVSGNSIAAADLLGNGRTDLAVAFTYPGTPGSGSVSLLLGSGDGTFLPPGSIPVPGVGADSILTGDFNGDGITDLAVVSNAGVTGNLAVLLGDGHGNFPTMFEYPAGGYGVAAVADFNGDGRADVANAVTNGVNVLLGVTTANPNPAIKANGVVNAASFAPVPLVPGSLATVSGIFPVTGLSLQFANRLNLPVPLLYVSPTQVNFQVPWELPAPSQTTITAIANSQSSIPQNVTIASFAPGIFPGAILDSNYRPVDSTNPATAGSSVVQIYCTGLGPVANQPADGAPASSQPLSTTPYIPVVSIGGAPAQVLFSGLAPGAVGLYQVNALVPARSSKGPAVPVAIQGGSNIVTIAVQ